MKGLPSAGARFDGDQEPVRRNVFLAVTLFAWVGQTLILGLNLVQHLMGRAVTVRWDMVSGLILCNATLLLMWNRRVTLRQIEYGVMTSVSMIVGSQLLVAARQPQALLAQHYFIVLLTFLAAFCILPIRQATVFTAVLYLVFAVLALSRSVAGDPSLLIYLGMAAMLMVNLSLFGRQISTERVENRLYQTLALSDPLTGLNNRRAMYPRLDEAHASPRTTRTAPQAAALLLLDIDHFKVINDRHGHQLGDQVLEAVAAVLRSLITEHVSVARWGGEEFLLLLTGPAAAQAPSIADTLLHQMGRTPMPGGVQVTFSGGLAYSGEAETVPIWLNLADSRQYEAKRQGRNRIWPQAS